MAHTTISGTYGDSNIPCNVLIYTQGAKTWYCVEGCQNVNCTYDNITESQTVDVELINDADYFHYKTEINTPEELQQAVEA
jgi:hypothetical protein